MPVMEVLYSYTFLCDNRYSVPNFYMKYFLYNIFHHILYPPNSYRFYLPHYVPNFRFFLSLPLSLIKQDKQQKMKNRKIKRLENYEKENK